MSESRIKYCLDRLDTTDYEYLHRFKHAALKEYSELLNEIARLKTERDELKAEQKESAQRFLVLWSKYWDLKNKQPKEQGE